MESANLKVAIDTNLLLLLMFATSKRNPSKDPRLSRYNSDDVALIERLVCDFSILVTTPNILAETSNMTKGYHEYVWLKEFILNATEIYIPSRLVAENPLFSKLGLTDLCLISSEFQDCFVITDDRELSYYLESLDRKVILYEDYRKSFGYLN